MSAVLLTIAAGLFAAAEDPKPTGATSALDGTWAVASSTFDGRPVGAEVVKKRRLIIRGGKLVAVVDGAEKDPLTITLDPDKKPKQIDIARPAGKGTALGIYAVEGDELKLCYGEPGRERPTEFASPAGSRVYLMTLRREKAKP